MILILYDRISKQFFRDMRDGQVQPEADSRPAVRSSHPTNEGSYVGELICLRVES